MYIYNYNRETKEFISKTKAKESPRQPGVFFTPANATDIEPPEAGENETAIFADGNWELTPDYRGVVFWDTTTKKQYTINKLGNGPDSDWTDQCPDNAWQKWNGSSWEDDLDTWLNVEVRPPRKEKLTAADALVARYKREVRQGKEPTISIEVIDDYIDALLDLPGSLTEIVDSIPWPTEPTQ